MTDKPGKLMDAGTTFVDAPQIMREFGFKQGTVDKIIRWCFQTKKRGVKLVPPEGRKTWVYREDVLEWIDEHTQSAA